MKLTRSLTVAGLLASSALALSACGSNNAPAGSGGSANASAPVDCAKGSLSGGGSTFQQTLEQQLAASYGQQCGAQITYQGTGSGAGIQSFANGTVDFAGSDGVMKPAEQTAANARCGAGNAAIHVPITAGGVALLYKLNGVKNLNLDGATLAKIFSGKITTWNDPAIAALNSGETLPSTPIQVAHRSDSSGTTQVFTGYLKATGGADWTLGSDKTVNWPVGQGKSGSAGVASFVAQTEGGITYAETTFAKQNNLPTAKVKSGSTYVAIDSASVSAAIAAATVGGTAPDTQLALNYAVADGKSYPISTVSYAIVCNKGTAADKLPLLKGYLKYFVTTGQSQADALGFAPLPQSLVSRDTAAIDGMS
ncbi:MAG: phosphate transporter substrate-binding protein PhoT family [Mycobacterium sp.]|nr:phosphate transporter substrate-binding protein PhoT family [Mycobacterium sp.]